MQTFLFKLCIDFSEVIRVQLNWIGSEDLLFDYKKGFEISRYVCGEISQQ